MSKKTDIKKSTFDELLAEFAKGGSAQQRYDYFRSRPGEQLDDKLAAELAGYHFVLIGGLGSPLINAGEELADIPEDKRYFGALEEQLTKIQAGVTMIHPHSVEIEQSAQGVIDKVKKIRAGGEERPIILIGQSRGGMVATKAAMMAPELLREGIIKKVMTVQSPVNGHASLGSPVVQAIAEAGLGFLKPGGNFGLRPLLDKNIRKLFNTQAFQQEISPADQELVSDSILWFTGYAKKLPLLPLLAGPTDIAVPLVNQFRTDYGQTAGVVEVNHIESMIKMGKKEFRRLPSEALALVLMETLAKNLTKGPEWARVVSIAEENRIHAAMKQGPQFRLFK